MHLTGARWSDVMSVVLNRTISERGYGKKEQSNLYWLQSHKLLHCMPSRRKKERERANERSTNGNKNISNFSIRKRQHQHKRRWRLRDRLRNMRGRIRSKDCINNHFANKGLFEYFNSLRENYLPLSMHAFCSTATECVDMRWIDAVVFLSVYSN